MPPSSAHKAKPWPICETLTSAHHGAGWMPPSLTGPTGSPAASIRPAAVQAVPQQTPHVPEAQASPSQGSSDSSGSEDSDMDIGLNAGLIPGAQLSDVKDTQSAQNVDVVKIEAGVKPEPDVAAASAASGAPVKQEPGVGLAHLQTEGAVKQEPGVMLPIQAAGEALQEPDAAALSGLGSYGSDSD